MKAKCSVTFEYEVRHPETWKGTVKATAPNTVVSRAVRMAMRKLHPRNWSSLVVVILERDDVTSEDPEQVPPKKPTKRSR